LTDFLLRAAAGIDDDGPFKNRWFIVKKGVLADKGPLAAPPELPPGFPVIDIPFISPPLFDAHLHLSLTGAFDTEKREGVSSLPRDKALERILGLLERFRSLGILTVRDGGDPSGLALEAAREAAKAPLRYSKVLPSARPLVMKGRYGSFLGAPVASLKESLKVVEENIEAGATQIKVIATGINSLTRAGDCGDLAFFPDEVAGIMSRCDQDGVPVMVHLNGPLSRVFPAKHNLPVSVEHGFYFDNSDIARIAAGDTFWTPTLTAWSALLEHPGLGEDKLEVVALTDVEHSSEVGEGIESGCRILAGSDAGTPGAHHGDGFFAEVNALLRCGLTLAGIFSSSSAYLQKWAPDQCSPFQKGGALSFLGWKWSPDKKFSPPDFIYSRGAWVSSVPNSANSD